LFFLVILLDQATKAWAFFAFEQGQLPFGPLFDYGVALSFTFATNTGAAWGIFSKYPLFLSLVRVGLVFLLIGYLFSPKCQKKYRLPLSLIIGGAIGNLIEMLAYGYVTDMISISFWGWHYPVFNVADAAIFCGVVLAFLANTCGGSRADSCPN